MLVGLLATLLVGATGLIGLDLPTTGKLLKPGPFLVMLRLARSIMLITSSCYFFAVDERVVRDSPPLDVLRLLKDFWNSSAAWVTALEIL
jgi:hypothetical protein